jgi:cell division protein FtsL
VIHSKRIVPLPIIISLILLSISVYSMFRVKYQVRNLMAEVKELEKQIVQEKESIKVLGAELSYLNQPKRLKKIAEKYLAHYEPIKVSQINPNIDVNHFNNDVIIAEESVSSSMPVIEKDTGFASDVKTVNFYNEEKQNYE